MVKFTVATRFTGIDGVSSVVKKMKASVLGFGKSSQANMASIGSPIRGIRNLITGIAAVLTTGAIAKGINDFANKGDEIAKTARMLGLTAEALQELRFAADREGVSAENLTTAFRLMNKNIGDLQIGQGELSSKLKLSNPALAQQLRTVRSSEEAFNILIDAVGKETNTAKRAALAQAAFGRSGQELIKMAIAGTAGIADLRKEARRLGLVIDQEAATAAERFQDSMTDLKASLRGVANTILGPLIKNLQPLIQRLTEWVVANRSLIGQKISSVFKAIGDVIRFATPYLKTFFEILAWTKERGILKWLVIGIVALTAATWAWNAAAAANPIGLVIMGIMALIAIIVVVKQHWKDITAAVGRAWGAFKDFATGLWTRVVGAFQAVKQAIFDLLNNPLILAAGLIFAPFITIPLLIAKHWEAVRATIASVIQWVLAAVEKISGAGRWVAGLFGGGGAAGAPAGNTAPISPGAAAAAGIGQISKTVQESRSTVDINMAGLPAGSTVRQRGKAPGVTINTGLNLAGAH